MTLDEWVIHGETGISSKTMWAAVKGVVKTPKDYNSYLQVSGWGKQYYYKSFSTPSDRDDFNRCYKLYKQCNLTKEDLNKVCKAFPKWKGIIENWDELCRLHENNLPFYEFLQSLIK